MTSQPDRLSRLDRIHRSRRRSQHQHRLRRTIRLIPETYLDLARNPDMTDNPSSVYLVAKRPPLSNYPPLWRWLARFVYRRINWCPDYGIEYDGVYTDEAEARFAASEAGGFYMELPLNTSLPPLTAQYGTHDFPLSDASPDYRGRKFNLVTISRHDLERLGAKIEQTINCAEGRCTKIAKVV